MSLWKVHEIEAKVIDILRGVPPVAAGHRGERPFLTAYQVAIEFAQRHPEIVEAAGWTVGGAGSGKGYSLAQYLASSLARYARDHPAGPIERVFLSNQQVNDISFMCGEELISSSVTAASPALALYRLRDTVETPDAEAPSLRVASHERASPAGVDRAVQTSGIGQAARVPVVTPRARGRKRTRTADDITDLTVDGWRERLSRSNAQAMEKRHQYPPQEGSFLLRCCSYQAPTCSDGCFCRDKINDGVWTLRPDLAFETFLHFYGELWIGTQRSSFKAYVHDATRETNTRWAAGMRLLRAIGARWSNWDGAGHSLPELTSRVRRCFFCDDAFSLIAPFVDEIRELCDDSSGVYASKLVSQLFYDIAVPFDTHSKGLQKRSGYEPTRYGGGAMQRDVQSWLVAHSLSIAEFRRMDDATLRYWRTEDRPRVGTGTACSRVLDKLFYG